ncbi:MAG: secretion system protein [Thermoproteus sp.]
MNREEFYLYVAPIFATYLAHASSAEALRRAAAAAEGLNRKFSRELLLASLMPNPASALSSDRLAVVRQYGFAISQEEAGVPKQVLVKSFLESTKAIALGRLEAAMQHFLGLFSSLSSLMFAPLLLLFLYAYGLLPIDLYTLLGVAGLFSALIGLLIYRAMPKDLSPVKTYGPSAPIAVASGGLALYLSLSFSLPLSLSALASGLALTIWLFSTKRASWFRLAHEVPAMLRDFASRISQGVPADLALREVSTAYKTAWMVAYFYEVPSLMFSLAKAMFEAVSWAGPSLEAVDYIQTILSERERGLRRVTALTVAFIAVYLAASTILVYSLSVSTNALQLVPSTGQALLYPLPPEEVEYATAQLLSVMAAGFVSVTLFPSRGLWIGLLLGGLMGLALFYSANWLWAVWS